MTQIKPDHVRNVLNITEISWGIERKVFMERIPAPTKEQLVAKTFNE
jgi:hypothetical protein